MVVTEKKYINNGNNALNPKRKPFREENNEFGRKDNEELRKSKQIKLRKQAMVMACIGLVFILGFSVVYRYSVIYTMQIKLQAANTNVDNIGKDNENLRLQLVQYNRLGDLQDKASKLNMVAPQKNNAVSLNYDKQTLKLKSSGDVQDKKNIFTKLLGLIK